MTTVFVHDHRFKFLDGVYYSEGQLTSKTWERFLNHDDELIVVGRVVKMQNLTGKFSISSADGVSFNCFNQIKLLDRLFPANIDKSIAKIISSADHVVCRIPSFLGRRAFKIAKKLEKKVLVEVVGCPYDSYRNHGSYMGKILAPIERLLMKRILANSTFSVYVTKTFLQSRYPTSGLQCSISNVELVSHNIRSEIKPKANKIAFIGSLSASYKGLSDLITSLSYVTKENDSVELHVLGSGDIKSYKSQASALGVEDKIYFHEPIAGGVPVLKWLSQFDLYVQPSHTEGLPRALIEAMSVGLPCIASDVGGIPELLNNSSLFPAKDAASLSDLIILLLNDYNLRKLHSSENVVKAQSYLFDSLSKLRKTFLDQFYST